MMMMIITVLYIKFYWRRYMEYMKYSMCTVLQYSYLYYDVVG
jgi:hypothetical protein